MHIPRIMASAAGIQASTNCLNPVTRQEWRALSTETHTEYMNALKCMTTKPSRLGLESSLYDDFPYVHNALNMNIHFVAQFLPWHRYFVHLYEQALHDCGFTQPMPYWDWTKDAGALPSSQVIIDFGGNGEGGGWSSPSRPNPLTSCVTAGPFADRKMVYYQGNEQEHCLNRQLNNGTGSEESAFWSESFTNAANVQNITDTSDDFVTFWDRLENGPHGAIHNAIGGDMIPATSPNDPLFFLHHAQIDRLWWIWQQADAPARNADFGGKTAEDKDATVDDVMPYLALAYNSTITIEDVMTTTDKLCYTYE